MTHRTVIDVCLPLTFLIFLFACGDDNPPVDIFSPSDDVVAASETPSPTVLPSPVVTASNFAIGSSLGWDGRVSLEERILRADVIVKARLQSSKGIVELVRASRSELKYGGLIEFTFTVHEYIQGSGPTTITVVAPESGLFDTQQEAEDFHLPKVLYRHNPRWDDRNAILFLEHSSYIVPSTDRAERFFLANLGPSDAIIHEDSYSVASLTEKLWLPAVMWPDGSGPGEETFLLDAPFHDPRAIVLNAPISEEEAPKITLSEFKSKVAALQAELNAGTTDEYKLCVYEKYSRQRYYLHRLEWMPSISPGWTYKGTGLGPSPSSRFASGQPAGTIVQENANPNYDPQPGRIDRNWIDSHDADLFYVRSPDTEHRITAVRPLPKGEYKFFFNGQVGRALLCDGYADRYLITVTVTATENTRHEMFFDPVIVGSAVSANASNGVLEPASFSDANGGSATIHRISYDSGAVTMTISPVKALAGHILDFIALDGSVSLSLNIDEATLDPNNHTLIWPIFEQPWHHGDKLMLRISKPAP